MKKEINRWLSGCKGSFVSRVIIRRGFRTMNLKAAIWNQAITFEASRNVCCGSRKRVSIGIHLFSSLVMSYKSEGTYLAARNGTEVDMNKHLEEGCVLFHPVLSRRLYSVV